MCKCVLKGRKEGGREGVYRERKKSKLGRSGLGVGLGVGGVFSGCQLSPWRRAEESQCVCSE